MSLPRLAPSLHSGFQLTAMTIREGHNGTPCCHCEASPLCHCEERSDEAISKLNPEQTPIARFKTLLVIGTLVI